MTQALTQAEKAAANYKQEDLDRQAYDLVQYLLLQDYRSMIKKADITSKVLKDYSKCFGVLFEKAVTILNDIYGLRVIEHDEKKGQYIIVNALQNSENFNHILTSEEDDQQKAILLPILALIFMSDNCITDEVLWKFLQTYLKLKDSLVDPVLGDVRRLIHVDFCRQGYLDVTRLPDTDPIVHEIRWGFRAKQELNKSQVLNFVCEIYENDPSDWPQQIQDAESDEGMNVEMASTKRSDRRR